MVLLHRVWKKHPVNVDFLGIYIPDNNQYSPLVHGLIGRLRHQDKAQSTTQILFVTEHANFF